LLDDITKAVEDGTDVWEIPTVVSDVKLEQDEIIDHGRWYVYHESVFSRWNGNLSAEYVGVQYAEPATEMQEADDEPVEIYHLDAYEEKVTKFRRR
jgi:hypothetical protein